MPKRVSFEIPEIFQKPDTKPQEVVGSSSRRDLERVEFSFLKSPQEYHPSSIKNRRALDLFSGTGAVGRRLTKLGFEVTTLDWDKNFNPDICVNIMDWDYKQYAPGIFG